MGSNASATIKHASLDGGRVLAVLLAEDEPMISASISDDLEEAGYRIAGPFRREADALAWLEGNRADLAVLDLVLRDGLCTALAERLRRDGIPFLIFSGYFRGPDLPAVFRGAPWIEKPGGFEQILAKLEELARG
jgi:DNA-binding response OmpR family regulator